MTKRLAGAVTLALLFGMDLMPGRVPAQQNPAGLVLPATAKVKDQFTPLLPAEVALQGGMLGMRVTASEKNRLLHVDENDLLDAFERRDVPHQDWQGEHVGKFLHAATLAWNYTQDPALRAKIDRVVSRLLKTQEADGYLGTYPGDKRWTRWDVWVHKYDLLGLLTCYQFTGNKDALAACRRVGDLLIRTFGTGPGQRDINKAGEHVGMAADSVLEPIVLLYRATGDPRYLQFASYIVTNYDAPGGPAILASLEKYRSVRRVANAKAYEMVSNFNGLLELYRVTGSRDILNLMEIGWNDIVNNRLYLTGGASSFEHFQDDDRLPNGERASICETCVTVTWEQMNLQLLRLTGDAKYADQLERAIYNHLLAAQKPTGDMWAYYTPLEGHKPYGNSTNCCLSSGPRGVALIPSIACMTSADGGFVVNLYNSGTATTRLPSGRVTVAQKTDYPRDGKISLTVTPEKNGAKFPLRLRLPAWMPGFSVAVNGQVPPRGLRPGAAQYLTLDRNWHRGDTVTLTMQMPERVVRGDHDNAGKAAILYGPLVLALDTALNPGITGIRRVELAGETPTVHLLPPAPGSANPGDMRFQTEGKIAGENATKPLLLAPYANAGQDGKSRFEVWIPLPGHASRTVSDSVFSGARMRASRRGNMEGDITDDDFATFVVTYNGQRADADWFAVMSETPVRIGRVVFAHGRTFHDGGWFDTSGGRPQVQVRTEPRGEWRTLATLASYPNTTAADAAGLKDGQTFEAKFAPTAVFGVRILGRPACGDNPAQAFSSCAELQAFPE
jgi:DUF1680 family protein